MKVNWILRANISDINFNQSYSDYDDRCLESTYWLYDITSFIKASLNIVCLSNKSPFKIARCVKYMFLTILIFVINIPSISTLMSVLDK